MRVHQLLSGAGPVDAVTTQALAWRERFTQWGWGGRDWAHAVDPRVGRAFKALDDLDAGPDDVLLLHYSAYAPRLAAVLDRPQRKVLVSHNITPPHWFWDHEPLTAVQCAIGREQLPEFARRCDVAIGVSAFNARELTAAGAREVHVVPVLLDPARLGPPAAQPPAQDPPRLLFVGRLTPHKRQDLLLRLLALLRADWAPGATLTLVGEPISPPYRAELQTLADRLAPGAVTIRSFVAREELAQLYREATALVCASEHEGVCIPVLEAFHFGVPVVARAFGGVPETCGDAALLLAPDDGLPVAAEALRLLHTDPDLRAQLRERGHAALDRYDQDRTAGALRAVLASA